MKMFSLAEENPDKIDAILSRIEWGLEEINQLLGANHTYNHSDFKYLC